MLTITQQIQFLRRLLVFVRIELIPKLFPDFGNALNSLVLITSINTF